MSKATWPKVEIVLEPGEHNWSAYSPDVDGCVAVGDDPESTLASFKEALELHMEASDEPLGSVPAGRTTQ